MNEKVVPTTPALGISLKCSLGGDELVFQTHVAQDTDKANLDVLLDRLGAVAERQQAKLMLVELTRNLKVDETSLQNLLADRDRIDATLAASADNGRRNPQQLSPHQKKARDDSVVMEGKYREIIKRRRDEIQKLEMLVAGK